MLQSHGNSSIGSEASGVSPAQSTDGYDPDEQNSDQVRKIISNHLFVIKTGLSKPFYLIS